MHANKQLVNGDYVYLGGTHINPIYILDIFPKTQNFLYILLSVTLIPHLGILFFLIIALILCSVYPMGKGAFV